MGSDHNGVGAAPREGGRAIRIGVLAQPASDRLTYGDFVHAAEMPRHFRLRPPLAPHPWGLRN